MSYLLGIDPGDTAVTAAVLRPGGTTAGPVRLGGRGGSHTLPAVLVATPAGDLLCGEPARRRAPAEPDRVARGFLSRVGDPTPLSLGGVAYRPEDLCARLVRVVVDEVSARHGAAPSRIGLTHPAGWGRHKRDLLAGALARHGLTVALVAAPQAVALAHRAATAPAPSGPLAVVDLGGTGSTATVVAPAGPGGLPAVLGPGTGCRNAGADVDDAVFGFVRASGRAGCGPVAAALDALDPDDPQVLAALIALRDDCRAAKEVLSRDTETAVPVRLPGLHTSVRLHRGDLDELARPVLEPVGDLVAEVLAGHPDAEVLLTGGTARMPVAVQLLSAALGRPVTVAAEPVHGAARGAALAVAHGTGRSCPGARIPVQAGPREAGSRDLGTTTVATSGRLRAADPAPAPWTGRIAPTREAAGVALLQPPAGSPPVLPGPPPAAPSRTSRIPAARTPAAPSPTSRVPAARTPAGPERPAPDTLVTWDVTRAARAHPYRNRVLAGAGGLAGALAVTGALLFWPSSSPSLGELSAAPVQPDAATAPAAPAPVLPVIEGSPAVPVAAPGTAAAAATGNPAPAAPETPAATARTAAAPGAPARAPVLPPPAAPAPVPTVAKPAPPVPGPAPVAPAPVAPAPEPAPVPPPVPSPVPTLPEGSVDPSAPPSSVSTTPPAGPSSSMAVPAPA